MPGEPIPHDAHDRRIQRLEEALAFAQHENEQLSGEVLTLSKRVFELSRRVDALEQQQRARDAAAKAGEDPDAEPPNDPPPHSAGPQSATPHSAPPMRREGL